MTLKPPELLTDHHQLDEFSCGIPTLDTWLIRRARNNTRSGASRTYVLAKDDRVIGYYAIASGALALSDAPGRIKRNMPDPIPVAILGRLAIDQRHQGQGLGVALLGDAVRRVTRAASILGIRGILVHAINDDAKRFYEHHGFVPGATAPMTLIFPLPSPRE